MKELTDILSEGLIGSHNRNLVPVGEFFERIISIMTSVQSNQIHVQGAIGELYNFLYDAKGLIVRDGYAYDMINKVWKDEVLIGFLTTPWLGKQDDRIPVSKEYAYFIMPSENIYAVLSADRVPKVETMELGSMGIFIGPWKEGSRKLIMTAENEDAAYVFSIPKNHPLRKEAEDMCRKMNAAAV